MRVVPKVWSVTKELIMSEANQDVLQDETGDNGGADPQVNWEQKAKELERYKNDMYKFKDRSKTLEQQNEEMARRLQEMETQRLEGNKNYRELWERAEAKAQELDSKYRGVLTDFEEGKKMDAIRQEALKMGIKEEALSDLSILDKSIVAIERTDRGNVNILGAREFVEDLKKARPFWFNDHSAPRLNSAPPGNPNTQSKTLTPKEVLQLQKENPEAYAKYVLGHKGRL